MCVRVNEGVCAWKIPDEAEVTDGPGAGVTGDFWTPSSSAVSIAGPLQWQHLLLIPE